MNSAWVLNTHIVVDQALVEFGKLVNSVIFYQCFFNKQHNIRLIDVHQFHELSHQFFISLHATSSFDEHNVKLFVSCLLQCFFSNDRGINPVTSFIKWNI